VSRHRVIDAIDSLLGTTTFRGTVVRSRGGVFTDTDGLEPQSEIDALAVRTSGGDAPGACNAYAHERLRGKRRCHGCGRTRNEIEIDGG
jgi:hypothetical protein